MLEFIVTARSFSCCAVADIVVWYGMVWYGIFIFQRQYKVIRKQKIAS